VSTVDDVVKWRRDLHQIPELGFEERETSAYCADILRGLGVDVQSVAETGLVAEIGGRGGRRGPTVALRADMDGLPLQEESGEPFSSRHPGIMHACGHDVHMAVLLGTAARLARRPDFPGRVRLMLQPSEERSPSGAEALIQAGVLEGVTAVLGLHVWSPLPVGTVAVKPGVMMASTDSFEIAVHGRGGHGSEPDTAQDAVLIAAQTVVHLQTIVSRRVTPLEPCVVTVGTIQAGTASNIIAERALLTGTVRTLSTQVQDRVEREIGRIARSTAALQGATATVRYQRGVPPVVNHPGVVGAWTAALAGRVQIQQPTPSMGGEDFALYLQEIPGAFLFLGGRPEGEQFPHHSPHFRINEACLPIGVDVLERGARQVLEHPEVARR